MTKLCNKYTSVILAVILTPIFVIGTLVIAGLIASIFLSPLWGIFLLIEKFGGNSENIFTLICMGIFACIPLFLLFEVTRSIYNWLRSKCDARR